jgi:hypothetical protein
VFTLGLAPAQVAAAVEGEIARHPEPNLLAFVWGTMKDAGWLAVPDEPTKYRVMCLFNLVECLRLVLHPEH